MSRFYDVDAFRAGGSTLRPFELEEVGEVGGKRLVHLQSHFGLDSLSWARRGASVVGVDFSEPAVDAANALASELSLDARFVAADVYEAPAALGGERFDLVYTGLGALNWLPDLPRWAEVVTSLLAPGGLFYMSEFHPFSFVFGDKELSVEYGYFHDPVGERIEDEGGTYADLEAATVNNATLEWNHPISEVIGVLLDRGMTLESFNEHDYTLSPQWPFLEVDSDTLELGDVYRLPEGMPSLPLLYSLRARR